MLNQSKRNGSEFMGIKTNKKNSQSHRYETLRLKMQRKEFHFLKSCVPFMARHGLLT